ncbi:MAG: pilus assembly protein N-terminal domain-containing protein [Candidatus Omnitrophica bacterium]|nr:pilus assembly protein N-terminal domain-containing protein [Candidatus Omnitrophota bacterium]
MRTIIFSFLVTCIWLSAGTSLWAQDRMPGASDQGADEQTSSSKANQNIQNSDTEKPEVKVANKLSESSVLETIKTEKSFLALVAGRSHMLKFRKDIKRISVSDPEVLDFVILNPKEVLLNARKQGAVNVIVWGIDDQISVFDISVTPDPAVLLNLVKNIDPDGDFEVYASKDAFIVKGEATSEHRAKQIEQAVTVFAEGSTSIVKVKDAKQVLLKTRFIQVDRNQDYDFGIGLDTGDRLDDGNVLVQHFLPGSISPTSEKSSQTIGSRGKTYTIDIFDRDFDQIYQFTLFGNNSYLDGIIKALETKGIAKTIAHPNLLCRDGEEGSFTVGGEAAILVSTGNEIQVQYKEFGTRLTFKPEILPDGKIKLTVQPEVSALSAANGVVSGDTSVPGFSTTKVKTVVELRDKETFVIGGLLQQKLNVTESGVPYLRRLPIVGKLFQDLNQDLDLVELIILITPRFVLPDSTPLGYIPDKRDILSVATQIAPPVLKDEHSDAITEYFTTEKRFSDTGVETKEIKLPEKMANPIVGISPPLDMKKLDELEAKLQWKAK